MIPTVCARKVYYIFWVCLASVSLYGHHCFLIRFVCLFMNSVRICISIAQVPAVERCISEAHKFLYSVKIFNCCLRSQSFFIVWLKSYHTVGILPKCVYYCVCGDLIWERTCTVCFICPAPTNCDTFQFQSEFWYNLVSRQYFFRKITYVRIIVLQINYVTNSNLEDASTSTEIPKVL